MRRVIPILAVLLAAAPAVSMLACDCPYEDARARSQKNADTIPTTCPACTASREDARTGPEKDEPAGHAACGCPFAQDNPAALETPAPPDIPVEVFEAGDDIGPTITSFTDVTERRPPHPPPRPLHILLCTLRC
ncbi:MAG: hypothetical protein ACYTAF_17060 [Planctomycetota bacterium]|jgi:hypothetical protein